MCLCRAPPLRVIIDIPGLFRVSDLTRPDFVNVPELAEPRSK